MKITNKKRESYSRYKRVFKMSLTEIKAMPREEFTKKFGQKFKYFSNSKFFKHINKIVKAYERGIELLPDYQ